MTQKLGPKQKQWVDALRSGKYNQCRGNLHVLDVGHCCLGVACDIFLGKEDSTKQLKSYKDISTDLVGVWDGESTDLPHDLLIDLWFADSEGQLMNNEEDKELHLHMSDLDEKEPFVDNPDFDFHRMRRVTSLVGMNDEGMTFEEIANFVEKYPHMVFIKEA